ncbi:FlgO family outer membrane protein [Methylophilus sp.]|jgi:TolB-like protein|uniref:FlgO family outer membrane protein n=1 Tax=Methylophilus sp. TaxID=29541 RepID=UPI000D48FE1D|nr:FlgO family outer membrane protein [Methylophilus sp.]PPD13251.1 MAG: hypothetical protein CTY26_00075 [Methylophilus sp.]
MRYALVLMLCLSGCATHKDYSKSYLGSTEFIKKNQVAVDQLAGQLGQGKVQKDYPVLVASVVSMNQLNRTSTFSRLLSEQVSARFSQLQYQVVEPKLRGDLMIREDGEFLMTRELKEIAKSVSAQAVVVGTYVETSQDIFVNLKVVQPETNHVLAAASYAIPMAKDVTGMLKN